jgi:hypothetical protein
MILDAQGAQTVMQCRVSFSAHNVEIIRVIVRPIEIDVMHDLRSFERPANLVLRNQSRPEDSAIGIR